MEIPEADNKEKDLRLDQARTWIQQLGVELQSELKAVAGDASFRRYFRLKINGKSRILMDAPPPGEDVRPFIDIDRLLRATDLLAPEIIHADTRNGFLLLEDLGDDLYRGLLNEGNSDSHFPGLFDVLAKMALSVDADPLPDYDSDSLRNEMDLFPDWYLGQHRNGVSRDKFDQVWAGFCKEIIDSALDQPQCFVHRDFHSCNLLKTDTGGIGIIDFQDAKKGPISYDFISLIWDRYIDWPRERIEGWTEEYRQLLELEIEPRKWLRYCDLMGIQRNFKVVGIFARLYYRDEKAGYLEMIPRFYGYINNTLRLYPEFREMSAILEQTECVP
jgi:aminoglycoside/choline kinase family phosphotransferase